MARIFIDGFESGSLDLWDGINTTGLASGIAGMDGNYSVNMTVNYRTLTKNITPIGTLYGAFRIKFTGTDGTIPFITFYNSSQVMIQFKRNNITGCIEAYVGTTLVATGSAIMDFNTTNLIEFYIYIADAGGRISTKVNSILDIDFTGDTKPSTQTTIDHVVFNDTVGANTLFYYLDNVILDDANWVGDTKIQAIYPNGAGATTAWTPSAGANYTCVDEIPPNDTDWVETNTINLTDTYTASDLVGVINNINCVQVQARSMREGAPTPTNADLVVRSGGTDYPSADKPPQSTFYESIFAIWEVDPATAAAWTPTGVNNVEIGIKSKT